MVTEEVRSLARTLWNYNVLKESLQKSDCIMVLCSHDVRVASYAAELFKSGWAPYLLFSGGLSDFTSKIFKKPEAEIFAEIAIAAGIPSEKILIENKSSNTGENLKFTAKYLQSRGLDFKSFIMLQKPSMLRRVKSAAEKQWPGSRIIVSSPPIPFEECHHSHVAEDLYIHELVGDFHRIKIYAERGFQTPQEIPPSTWTAFEKLVALGFTGNLAR
jgi:uncharacterized SAM-binding protein YcdF (DUF218 family)